MNLQKHPLFTVKIWRPNVNVNMTLKRFILDKNIKKVYDEQYFSKKAGC